MPHFQLVTRDGEALGPFEVQPDDNATDWPIEAVIDGDRGRLRVTDLIDMTDGDPELFTVLVVEPEWLRSRDEAASEVLSWRFFARVSAREPDGSSPAWLPTSPPDANLKFQERSRPSPSAENSRQPCLRTDCLSRALQG